MADFNAILNKGVEEAERPKPLPAGTYRAKIEGHEFGESRQKGTPYCRVRLNPIEAQDDVDGEQLDEVLKQTDGDLSKKLVSSDFYLTEQAMWRLREFMENTLGIKTSGRTFAETIPEMDGMTCLVSITHQSSQDGKETYANVSGFAADE
jgi:hypothetical protein